MARPRKNDNALSVRKEIRMHPDELNLFTAKAKRAGLSVSEFLRRAGKNVEIKAPPSGADLEEVRALNKIGININQAVRKLNSMNKLDPSFAASLARLNAYLDKAEGI